MTLTHELRNWLHHLLLAAQVGHVGMLAQNFAPDVQVEGPNPEARWQGLESWTGFLQSYFATLQIGELSVKLLDRPEIRHEPDKEEAAQVRWQMHFYRVGMADTLTLDCEAHLAKVEQRWVAHHLWIRALPP
jgi:hypothetical protein